MSDSAQDYMVIGATAAPGDDELPQFLDAVCRAPDQDDVLYVVNTEPWDGSEPGKQPIARHTFDEECESGYWQRLDQEHPFSWSRHLVALDPGEPPEYLRADDARRIVQSRGEEALRAVALDIQENRIASRSDERVWYAARALPDDPFPLLALLSLERGRLSKSLAEELESELVPPEQYVEQSPLHRRALEESWDALLKLIAKDATGARYIKTCVGTTSQRNSWLQVFRNKADFLPKLQIEFGHAQRA